MPNQISALKINQAGQSVNVPTFPKNEVKNDFLRFIDEQGNKSYFNAVDKSEADTGLRVIDGDGDLYEIRNETFEYIDGFEDGNLDEYGDAPNDDFRDNYKITDESNSSVSAKSDGAQSTTLLDRGHTKFLECTKDSALHSASGLKNYPERGDKFSVWILPGNSDGFIGSAAGFYWADISYFASVNADENEIRYNPNQNLKKISQTINTGSWYQFIIDFDDPINAKCYDSDGNLLSDFTFTDNREDSGKIMFEGGEGSKFDSARIFPDY